MEARIADREGLKMSNPLFRMGITYSLNIDVSCKLKSLDSLGRGKG